MNVIYIAAYYPPEIAASLYLFENINIGLVNNKHTVTVYTPKPSRGVSKEVRVLYRRKSVEKLFDGNLVVKRYWMFSESKKHFSRAIRYILCNFIIFFKLLFAKNQNVITLASTPPIQILSAISIKLLRKIPIIYYLQDIFPDSLVTTEVTNKKSILYRIGLFIEKISYMYSDHIIVISEGFKENLIEKGVPEKKISVVYNWVDQNTVVPIKRNQNSLFDKYNLDRDLFYIVYSGNIGQSQNLELLLKVAKEFDSLSDIKFVLIGDGSSLNTLKDEVIENDINNIIFIPFQDYSLIAEVFSLGDVGLVISKKGTGNNAVPSKTWSIMSAARPILASFDKGSEIEKIIESNKCGLFVDSDDMLGLINAIKYLFDNPSERIKMGENGRNYVINNLTREVAVNKYTSIIENIIYTKST